MITLYFGLLRRTVVLECPVLSPGVEPDYLAAIPLLVPDRVRVAASNYEFYTQELPTD